MPKTFEQLVKERNPNPPDVLLALDPGGTLGWAVFEYGSLKATGYEEGGAAGVARLLTSYNPTEVVFESYMIYPWRLKQHSMSRVPTIQLIGQIKLLCELKKVPCVEQTAQQAKGFATDDRLKRWAMFFDGKKHSNDAIRHGVVRLLFPKSNVKAKKFKVG